MRLQAKLFDEVVQHSLLLQEQGDLVDGGTVLDTYHPIGRDVAEVGDFLLGGLSEDILTATDNLRNKVKEWMCV